MKVITPHNEVRSPFRLAQSSASNKRFWRWGDDNMFPQALALMSRRSTVHRRIVNDKADYISGRGFSHDENRQLADFLGCVNSHGETMRRVLNKLAFDKSLFGNAFVEIVTDADHTFLSLFHQDASRCRLARDNRSVLMHHDWRHFTEKDVVSIPLFPRFAVGKDGFMHSCIHYKDYEPSFEHYGVPSYIAGLNVSAIAYKTDCWNISRLDNSFQPSGVLMIDGEMASDEDAAELMRRAERKFAGTPGQVMFLIRDCKGNDATHFVPMANTSDGDWRALHDQAGTDIVVAHSWFRTLSGLNYNSGFDRERVLNEYELALNTVILAQQEEILEPLRNLIEDIFDLDCSTLQVVNRPPTRSKPDYMRIWEARKEDGLDYDPADPSQQQYLATIKSGIKN